MQRVMRAMVDRVFGRQGKEVGVWLVANAGHETFTLASDSKPLSSSVFRC